jgi:alkaline phosphatase D
MIDTRLVGRSAQMDSIQQKEYQSEDRHLLGQSQMAWFKQEITKPATWKIIGNQVMVSPMDISFMNLGNSEISYYAGKIRNLDQWDGYPAEKRRVFDFIKSNYMNNIVFLTGDDHASFAYEVIEDNQLEDYQPGSGNAIAVELVTPSISSANFDEELPMEVVNEIASKYPEYNPHLRWVDLVNHGYILLEITPEKTVARYQYVKTLKEINPDEYVAKTLSVKTNSNILQ